MTNLMKVGKYAVPTYMNTKFVDWWKLLNEALSDKGERESRYDDAQDLYKLGFCPLTAAQEIFVRRS